VEALPPFLFHIMQYKDLLESKKKRIADSGFNIEESELNSSMFPFQKHIVRTALKAGKYAIFADCGLGKTLMQLEWANQVSKHTNQPVLILTPLAVSGQTIQEGAKFGIQVERLKGDVFGAGIYVTNYEQLENISVEQFAGVVLDESSILKTFTGKTKRLIIDLFDGTRFKLACTATPSPNDLNEIGNHSEFLDVLDAQDMRARWFVREEGMNNYRLKAHAKKDFYGWISSWATILSKPSDIGFDATGYDLPGLNYIEHVVKTGRTADNRLFADGIVNATNFNQELRFSILPRLEKVADIVNESTEPFLIWIRHNEEGERLRKLIPGSVEVSGSDKPEDKERNLLGFANGDFRVLITKQKIAQFGMNFQNCNNQVFASLDFSFESLYQSIRRSYRFGQKKEVNIYIITTDTMENVIAAIDRKQKQFEEMQSEMNNQINQRKYGLRENYQFEEYRDGNMWLMHGDSVQEIDRIDDNSLDLIVFSPPFSSLFTYSDYIQDMGNCESHDEFFVQYGFLLEKLYRKLKPGRLMCCHTKDLGVYKNSSGYTGMYDFTGEHTRAVLNAGFKLHSKVTIWTDPVLEMQRTKTQRLLYKTLTTDSSYTGIGMAEYITVFRKWEGDESEWTPVTNITRQNFPLDVWQKWASPVWMDIKRTDVLNGKEGTDLGDEKHIAPLQLEVIHRLVNLWSNPGETVFTPFLGIGSEAYMSIKNGRKAIGIELKDSYYQTAIKNCKNAVASSLQVTMFD
jgi:DNA modification methylase/superfamily II DNA or RNA helicase